MRDVRNSVTPVDSSSLTTATSSSSDGSNMENKQVSIPMASFLLYFEDDAIEQAFLRDSFYGLRYLRFLVFYLVLLLVWVITMVSIINLGTVSSLYYIVDVTMRAITGPICIVALVLLCIGPIRKRVKVMEGVVICSFTIVSVTLQVLFAMYFRYNGDTNTSYQYWFPEKLFALAAAGLLLLRYVFFKIV